MQNVKLSKPEIENLVSSLDSLRNELHKIIIGQDEVLDEIIIAFISGGHALLEGVPGLAKTLMVRTLADAVHLKFQRIQFTPDLMPTDIVGTEVLEEDHVSGKRFFKFNKGPVFCNLLLADEINRTPPKTQAALLEAMQENSVSYLGETHPLPAPFFVLATQNPIEQSGTYPLPEAQLDRFLLKVNIGYPSEREELQILTQTTGNINNEVKNVMQAENILSLQSIVRDVSISDELIKYVNRLIRSTRLEMTNLDYVKKWLKWGAGPRAGQAIILTAKARALLNKRFAVTIDDIRHLIFPVLDVCI